jgi:TetR/AcrR family transcriptional regulator, cholesterol catabolism regulator
METQQKIIENAAAMFMRYGVRSVSMDDIATKLGMSKKTIYQYYADKDSLVEASIKWDIEHDQKECMLCWDSSKNAIEEVLGIVEMMAEQMADINPLVLFEMEKFYPKAFAHFQDHKNNFILNAIKHNLARGIQEAVYREDINIEVIAKFRLESMMLIFTPDMVATFKKYNVNDLMFLVTEHFLYGIVNAKGFKILEKHLKDIKKK